MQLSLDPQQEVCGLSVTIIRARNGRSLRLHVTVANDEGHILKKWQANYQKARDESGLPDWAREVVASYLWGSAADVELAAAVGATVHLPQLPADLA